LDFTARKRGRSETLWALRCLSLIGIATTGCATTIYSSLQERRAQKPSFEFTAATEPDAVRDCIVERTSDYKQLGMSAGDSAVVPFTGGWTVRAATAPATWFADAVKSSGGSVVKVYFAGHVPKGLAQRIQSCAEPLVE
jgi:hypothetical protein